MSAANAAHLLPSVTSSGHVSAADTSHLPPSVPATPEKVPQSKRLYARLTTEPSAENIGVFRRTLTLVNVQVCTQKQYDALDAATKATYRSFHDLELREEARHYCRKMREMQDLLAQMRLSPKKSTKTALLSRFDAMHELHDDVAEELLTVHPE